MAKQTTSKKKTTKSTAKSGAKGTAVKQKPAQQKRPQHAIAEVFGIILIALGALFAVYLYSGSQDWLGQMISGYLLGMHGMFAYAVPVLFVIIGFFLILGGRKSPARGTLLTGIFTIWFVLCAIHMWTGDQQLKSLHQFGYSGYKFFDYISQFFRQFAVAWNEGVAHSTGGGVLGMILPTLLYVIGGNLLCWVVIIAGFIISLLLCTGISIKAYTQAFGNKVMEKLEEREQTLSEGYEEDAEDAPVQKPWKKGFSTTIDEEDARPVSRHAKEKKQKQLSFDELFEVPAAESTAKAKRTAKRDNAPLDFDLMPSDGRLTKKSDALLNENEEDELQIAPTPAPINAPTNQNMIDSEKSFANDLLFDVSTIMMNESEIRNAIKMLMIMKSVVNCAISTFALVKRQRIH